MADSDSERTEVVRNIQINNTINKLVKERSLLQKERDTLQGERNALQGERDALRKELAECRENEYLFRQIVKQIPLPGVGHMLIGHGETILVMRGNADIVKFAIARGEGFMGAAAALEAAAQRP